MKQNQHHGSTCMILGLFSLLSYSAIAQTVSVRNDELQDLVRAASASDRDVSWTTIRQLGVLASGDPALRDEIWRRVHVNTLGMKFVRVEPGTFIMGPDAHRIFDIQIAHSVTITKPFYIAVTEVTNEQFMKLFSQYRADATYSPDPDSPAVRILCRQISGRRRACSQPPATPFF